MKDVSHPIDTAPVARKRPEPSQPRNSGAYFRLSNSICKKSIFLCLSKIDGSPSCPITAHPEQKFVHRTSNCSTFRNLFIPS